MRLLRCKEVQDMIGMKHSKLYGMIGEGTFPIPVKQGSKTVRWVESEINDWILNLMEKRNTAQKQ